MAEGCSGRHASRSGCACRLRAPMAATAAGSAASVPAGRSRRRARRPRRRWAGCSPLTCSARRPATRHTAGRARSTVIRRCVDDVDGRAVLNDSTRPTEHPWLGPARGYGWHVRGRDQIRQPGRVGWQHLHGRGRIGRGSGRHHVQHRGMVELLSMAAAAPDRAVARAAPPLSVRARDMAGLAVIDLSGVRLRRVDW